LLPLHLLVCFHCLPHYTGNRPVVNRCTSLLTSPLVQLPVLSCMLAARGVTSLQECLLQSLVFSQFRVRSVFSWVFTQLVYLRLTCRRCTTALSESRAYHLVS
jgi:hypothetical protein